MEDSLTSRVTELLKFGFIELEADWVNHVDRLAYLIKYFARKLPIHIVLHASRKYIDMYSFFIDLELKIGDYENISFFWENDIEAIAYHVLMMSRFGKGVMFLIIPYNRKLCSQIENIRLVSCSKILWRAVENGWRIILINPIITTSSPYETIVTPYTYRLILGSNGELEMKKIEKNYMYISIKS
ncbi:MAG: hypothetical protein QXP72_02140 [Desulfurococcaceae archaeon]